MVQVDKSIEKKTFGKISHGTLKNDSTNKTPEKKIWVLGSGRKVYNRVAYAVKAK